MNVPTTRPSLRLPRLRRFIYPVTLFTHRARHALVSRWRDEFYNPGLKKCISRAPRLLGCEAAYYFPKDIDLCHEAAAPAGGHEASTSGEDQEPGQHEGGQSGGNLVVHVRSGDIFDDAVLKSYGQVGTRIHLLSYVRYSNITAVAYTMRASLIDVFEACGKDRPV